MAVAHLEVVDTDPLLACKPFRCLVAKPLGRPLDPLIWLAFGSLLAQEDETTGRRIRLAAEDGQPRLAHALERLAAGGGRELLAPDLKQERRQGPPRIARPPLGQVCARA